MIQPVHIATTTTITNRSTIVLNTGYLLTIPGLLKIVQVGLGIACVALLGYDFTWYYNIILNVEARMVYFLTVTTFLFSTFIQLISLIPTGYILTKNLHDVLYNAIAFGLILGTSIAVLVGANTYYGRWFNYEGLLAAAVIGIINSALYFVSALLAFRSYRGF